MPAVSVVVPIYKTERYLQKCVDSLLNQSLADIEIVLVDDGSPDSSGEIADKYAKKDPRIVVVHRPNGGLGPARNSGIEVASGLYIGFVDSDDWVEPCMFNDLYQTALSSGADIVVSGHCDVTNGIKTYIKPHPLAGRTIRQDEISKIRLNLYGHALDDKTIESFPMSVCMSIYNASFLRINSLKFKEILSEDVFFNLDAYKEAHLISFIGNTDYCYRKDDQDSITHTLDSSKLNRYLSFCSALASSAESEPASIRSECITRSKRTVIDYCRLYVGIVAQSDEGLISKLEYLRAFGDSGFANFSNGYPLEKLPKQQRLFHTLLLSKHYLLLLILTKARLLLKRKR